MSKQFTIVYLFIKALIDSIVSTVTGDKSVHCYQKFFM